MHACGIRDECELLTGFLTAAKLDQLRPISTQENKHRIGLTIFHHVLSTAGPKKVENTLYQTGTKNWYQKSYCIFLSGNRPLLDFNSLKRRKIVPILLETSNHRWQECTYRYAEDALVKVKGSDIMTYTLSMQHCIPIYGL